MQPDCSSSTGRRCLPARRAPHRTPSVTTSRPTSSGISEVPSRRMDGISAPGRRHVCYLLQAPSRVIDCICAPPRKGDLWPAPRQLRHCVQPLPGLRGACAPVGRQLCARPAPRQLPLPRRRRAGLAASGRQASPRRLRHSIGPSSTGALMGRWPPSWRPGARDGLGRTQAPPRSVDDVPAPSRRQASHGVSSDLGYRSS